MKTSSKILLGLFLCILLCVTIFAIYVASTLSNHTKWQEATVAISQERQLPHFYQIETTDGISVEFTQDSVQKIVVVADSLLLKDVITEVKDGKLLLHRNGNGNFEMNVIVKINVDSLTSLDVSAGSSFKSTNTLKGYALDAKVSSGGYVEGGFDFTSLKFDFSSGSNADIKGKTVRLEAEASSGSNFKAVNLASVSAIVKASSGGNMDINVSGDISVDASSGGNITYIGSPNLKSINVNSGGNLNKR